LIVFKLLSGLDAGPLQASEGGPGQYNYCRASANGGMMKNTLLEQNCVLVKGNACDNHTKKLKIF
jgi:hypothetical protein